MDQNCPNGTFPVKNNNSEHYFWIQYIRIIVMNKFQLQQTTFTLSSQKKKKKGYLNITIKFNKIALAYSHSQNI